jgi:hypothetical protein
MVALFTEEVQSSAFTSAELHVQSLVHAANCEAQPFSMHGQHCLSADVSPSFSPLGVHTVEPLDEEAMPLELEIPLELETPLELDTPLELATPLELLEPLDPLTPEDDPPEALAS